MTHLYTYDRSNINKIYIVSKDTFEFPCVAFRTCTSRPVTTVQVVEDYKVSTEGQIRTKVETEAIGSWQVRGQPGLHREFLASQG